MNLAYELSNGLGESYQLWRDREGHNKDPNERVGKYRRILDFVLIVSYEVFHIIHNFFFFSRDVD